MKFQTTSLLLALPVLTSAFPGFLGASKDELMAEMKKRNFADARKRSLVSSLVTGVVDDVTGVIDGLLGSIAENINPDDARPEPGYEYQDPSPTDSRGPCPGLNLLANYGYLPRDGYVTFEQVLTATAAGFNMGTDLATVLTVFAVLADGDIATESFYLGSGPDGVGGLNRHSTVEADVSPNREDYYNGCGDNHHLSSRLFKQNVQAVIETSTCAADPSADNCQFTLEAMTAQYDKSASFSKTNNPYLYYFPFPSIVSFAAFPFYPNFFSNGTYGAGGVANYESISAIMGAKWDSDNQEFEYVPERWPENWYRRSYEYGAVEALTEGLAVYLTNPIGMPFGQLGTDNLNAQTILCDVYQGINSVVPLYVSGTVEDVAAAVTWVLSKLDPYLSDTILGCPVATTSANSFSLFPDGTGSSSELPPAEAANVGNNVYNKIYFESAPETPQCSHTY